MARNIRSPRLENRTGRLKLPARKKPYFVKIDRGVALGYRRNQGPGTWVVRGTRDGEDWTATVAAADDHEEADGERVQTWWQAQARARDMALGQIETDTSKPVTVAGALDAYELDLKARNANPYNAQYIRTLIPVGLATKAVALLTARELRAWRDSELKRGIAPPSVSRACKSFKAALNLAASHDPRIINANAWRTGLAGLPDAERARNVILSEANVRALVAAAWDLDSDLGLLVECAAVTGARMSQLARLDVGDLMDGTAPWLSMPSSKKGRGQKKVTHYPVPIPVSLATRLRSNRPADAPLLLFRGARWGRWDHSAPVARAVQRAGLNPAIVTLYALRHSSIVRQLLAGVPIRVVAVAHNTSVPMIERNYSQHLSAHSDELTRKVMLDLGAAS